MHYGRQIAFRSFFFIEIEIILQIVSNKVANDEEDITLNANAFSVFAYQSAYTLVSKLYNTMPMRKTHFTHGIV